MLKQRVITAVVLLALLLPALFAPTAWPFALLILIAAAAGGWEWARLNGGGARTALLLGAIVALCCAAALASGWAQEAPRKLWWAGTAVWVLGGGLALWAGVAGWPKAPLALRWFVGAWSLWLAWLALANARAQGINFLLSVLCLVWAADIAAYFGGRAFGRHKLAPNISPGKTWEGVGSGLLGVFALAFAWLAVEAHAKVDSPSLYVQLRDTFGLSPMVLGLLVLAAISVVGDLVESLVKRAAGVKDSSGLLPGHGGVLDRVDALLPAFPLAMALVSI